MTDEELIEAWENFLESEDWIPGFNELADLSEMDGKEITDNGIKQLADYIELIYRKHNITSMKVGVYAPQDLAFGLGRIYEILSYESPESVCVFREMEKAEAWITNNSPD